MRFEYIPYEGNWLPIIPVVFGHKKDELPAMLALVDTGATHTILPIECALELGISVDLHDRIETQVAGGTQCFIYPSPVLIDYRIRDPKSGLEYQWKGPVFFTLGQQIVLLGHHRCLEKFHLFFKGPEKELEMTPRSVGRPNPRKK
jgi:hypothetical protein